MRRRASGCVDRGAVSRDGTGPPNGAGGGPLDGTGHDGGGSIRPPVPLALSIDVSAVPERPVGAGRYTVELVRALGRHDDLRLTLWCRRGDRRRWSDLAPADIVDEVPEARPLRLLWEQLALPPALRRRGVAVHHGPHYTLPGLSSIPLVATIHDLTFVDHPEWHERSKVLVFRRAISLARRRAAALICVSEGTARRLAATGGARGKVFVVSHGIDHERFRPDEPHQGADVAELARIGVSPPYVLFLGTIEPRKAVDILARAFDQVAGGHRDLTLVLAGRDGWGGGGVETALASMTHRQRVVRTGYVADTVVPALLRQAATVCYPALEEGFGLPALEAVACGAPLVTTAGSVMADLVGSAALLAEAGSVDSLAAALGRSLGGGSDALARRRDGLAVAAAHTWEACAAGHVAVYRWAAGHRRRPK